MTELHTYRLAFRNGDVFKTNAESEKKALKNFRTTFTDSQILEKGGTAFPFSPGKKEEGVSPDALLHRHGSVGYHGYQPKLPFSLGGRGYY